VRWQMNRRLEIPSAVAADPLISKEPYLSRDFV
jgi:hypothetical protein